LKPRVPADAIPTPSRGRPAATRTP
jgi:hypothetical protein